MQFQMTVLPLNMLARYPLHIMICLSRGRQVSSTISSCVKSIFCDPVSYLQRPKCRRRSHDHAMAFLCPQRSPQHSPQRQRNYPYGHMSLSINLAHGITHIRLVEDCPCFPFHLRSTQARSDARGPGIRTCMRFG